MTSICRLYYGKWKTSGMLLYLQPVWILQNSDPTFNVAMPGHLSSDALCLFSVVPAQGSVNAWTN